MTGLSESTMSLAAVGFEVNRRQYMNPCPLGLTLRSREDILDLGDLDCPLLQ
jgi:hypothetical protein